VVKASGEVFSNTNIAKKVINDVAVLVQAEIQCVLVYGGGNQLSRALEKIGGKELHSDTNLRITPKEAIPFVERERRAIGAQIRKLLAQMDMESTVLPPDVVKAGRLRGHEETGDVISVDDQEIRHVLEKKKLPILGFGGMDDGDLVNTNADTVAAEVAAALKAQKLIILGKTDGIYIPNHAGERKLSFLDATGLIALLRAQVGEFGDYDSFVIDEGMLPKVDACLRAIHGGVKQVHIVGYDALLEEVLTDTGAGTLIEKHQSHSIEQAAEKDLPAIIALHEACMSQKNAKTPNGATHLKPLSAEELKARLLNTLILKYRGRLIGKIHYEKLKKHPWKTALIGGFAVAENHQGEQHGEELMQQMLQRLKDDGFEIALSITASPEVKRLFARLEGMPDAFLNEESYRKFLASARKRYGTDADACELFTFVIH